MMIDEFLQRVVAAFGRLRLEMRIGQRKQSCDQQRMRNALRFFQNDRERFDRFLRLTTDQIQATEQESLFISLR